MFSLELNVKKEKITIDKKIKDSFLLPIVFYLINYENTFLNTFVILDFQKEELIYYETFTSNNIDFLEKNKIYVNGIPHSATPTKDGLFSFLFHFLKKDYLFRFLDLKNNEFKVFSAKDLNHPDRNDLGILSDTSGLDYDQNYFYISFMDKNEKETHYYKCSTDLQDVEKIGTTNIFTQPPHQLCRFKNFILATGFSEKNRFQFPNGDICKNLDDYLKEKIKENFKNYPKISSLVEKHNPYGNTFSEITNKSEFKFKVIDGKVLVLDLNKKNSYFYTCSGKPAHIELDSNSVYTSSSNLDSRQTEKNNKLRYLTNASIEKVEYIDGEFKNNKIFTHKTGYRFTSHKVFRRNNIPYVAVLGYPNRLFIVNGISMKLEYYYDIDFDILSKHSDVRMFLNDVYRQEIDKSGRSNTYLSLEVSHNGKYIILFSQTHIRFFSLDDKKIIFDLPFTIKDGFIQTSYHCDYLKN